MVSSPGKGDLLDASTMLFLLGKASSVSEVLDREFRITRRESLPASSRGTGTWGRQPSTSSLAQESGALS